MTEGRRRLTIVVILAVAVLGGSVALLLATSPRSPQGSSPPATQRSTPPTPAVDATIRAFRDFTVMPGGPPDPAGRPLQSRLWSIEGVWWAAMVEPATHETRIHQLSVDGSTWNDTEVLLDPRPGAMVDVLWSGEHLYVASAVPGRSTANGIRVARYSREPGGRFVLDPDFPVRLTERGVGAVSLARDGSGRLWAAAVQDGSVLVAHSTDDEAVWTAPGPAASGGAFVGAEDVAALVADGAGGLGLVWSNGLRREVSFARRADVDEPDQWTAPEIAFEGLPLADEPISVATAIEGSIFVSIETAVADDPAAGQSDPGVVLATRDTTGAWRSALAARVADHLGQPLTLVDPTAAEVYVLASSPRHGGSVHLKRTAIDRLEFPAGRGLTVIADPTEPDIAFLTSAKQPIDLAAGFVVLGFDQRTGFYWHALIGPGTTGGPSAPPSPSLAASPSPSASVPPAGRTVRFTDTFDPWPLDGPIGNGWELGPAGVAGSLTAAADPAGSGANALLRPAGGDAIRACKSFDPALAGTLVAEIRVRLEGIGAADAVITTLRDRSGEAASVRFGQGGTFAWYAGPQKLRSTVPFRAGTWYRSTVTVDLDGRAYAWRLTDDAGKVLIEVSRIPFREGVAVTQVSDICVQTSAGSSAVGVRFDDVRVSR